MKIDSDYLMKKISLEIQHAIITAAEPIIQQTLKDSEFELRKKVAEIAMTRAQSNFDIRTQNNVIEIRIGLNGNKAYA